MNSEEGTASRKQIFHNKHDIWSTLNTNGDHLSLSNISFINSFGHKRWKITLQSFPLLGIKSSIISPVLLKKRHFAGRMFSHCEGDISQDDYIEEQARAQKWPH